MADIPNSPHIKLGIGLIFVLSLLWLSSPAFSQPNPPPNLERATRETDRLKGEDISKRLLTAPSKPKKMVEEETPPVAPEEKKFFVKKIYLSGCESFLPEDFALLVNKYENREVGLSELDILAKQIEREYLKRGVIAAVFVPPQEAKDQSVTLQVVEARMGELNISQGNNFFKKDRLRYYWKINSGDILHYDKISKSIQMMNKNTDREVKVVLSAGKKPSTTDVLLTSKTSFPIHSTFTLDNEGALSSGLWRTGLGIRDNNLLDSDDMAIAGYTFGSRFAGEYGYHTIPISPDGASLIYGLNTITSEPKGDYEPFDMRSYSQEANISVHQDLYKKDEYLGEVFTTFDAVDKKTFVGGPGGTINRDRLRILSLGGNFLIRSLGGSATISPEFYQGLPLFGANNFDDPLSTRHVQPNFSIFDMRTATKVVLPLELQQNFKVTTQFASEKVNPTNELSIGGIDSVRGYPSNDFLADSGYIINWELLAPIYPVPKDWRFPYSQQSLREQTTGLIFFDYGWGRQRDDTKPHNFTGVGGGIRMSLYNQALVRLEWGYPIGDKPFSRSRDWHFHFSLSVQEDIFEEINRIRQEVEEESIRQLGWELVDEELNNPNSVISQELHRDLYLAKSYYGEGKLQESKMFYEKISKIGTSLYKQADDYVRAQITKQQNLEEDNKQALTYYNTSRINDAKDLWEIVINEVKFSPLILEIK